MGKGKEISPEHAAIIYNAYLTQPKGFARRLCHLYGYKDTSYYKIINCCGKVVKNQGHKEQKWTKQQIEHAINYIEKENSQITLQELHDKMILDFNFPEISISTLWKYLDGELFTLKSATLQNQMRNSDENKNLRKSYAEWFLQNQSRTFLFIDECGFNLNTIRRYARSRSGTRAVIKVAQNKGTNMSICACVNKDLGLLFYEYKVGSMNGEDFTVFLSQLVDIILPLNLPNVTLIFDNCRIHVENDIDQVCSYAGWEYEYLPPYSPMLNIIEEAFSVIKSSIKKLMAGQFYDERIRVALLPFGQKMNARISILERALRIAIQDLTIDKTHSFWDHMMATLPICLNLIDI